MIVEMPPPHIDARHERRTSLFVMGTLYADSSSCPVKVRDLSPVGALIEGAVIPPPATKVRLVRGDLDVRGQIVWCQGARAGLRFEASLSVADWLPGARVNAPQQRIDEIVQQVRASVTVSPACPVIRDPLKSNPISAVELQRLGLAIDSLADDLAADPQVVMRHTEKLQTLDQVAQALRKLAIERRLE